MIKLIIFDWDDVITLGAIKGYLACYHKAANSVGVFLSRKEEKKRILAKWGKSIQAEMQELLKEKPELVDTACEFFEKEFWGDTFVSSLHLLSGTNELLIRLNNKYKLAVATGNHPRMLKERIIPYFKIPHVFSQIVSSEGIVDQEKTKPHPHMLEVIMEKQLVSSHETLFVGDSKTDVQMAKNANVEPIVVLTGNLNRSEAEELGAKYIIDSIVLIEKILDSF